MKLKMHCSPDLSESKFAVVIVVWCYILSLSKAYLPSITSRSTTNCLQSVHQFKAFTYFLFLSPFKNFFHFFEAGNVSTLSGCCFCTDCNILLFLFPRTISQTFRILFCCCVSGVLNYIMAATLLIYGGRGRNVVTGYLCCYSWQQQVTLYLEFNSENVNRKPCLLTPAFTLLNQRFELYSTCPSSLQTWTLAHLQTKLFS